MKNKRFTLIELLVVIAIIGILVTLLMPGLAGARYRAKTVLCASNMKQLGIGITLYTDDYNGFYPVDPVESNLSNRLADGTTFRWDQKVQALADYKAIQGYWGNTAKNIFLCPHAEAGIRSKYGSSWPYKQTNAYIQCYMLYYNTTAQSNPFIAQNPRMRRVGDRWQDARSSKVRYKWFNILAGDAMYRPAYGTGAVTGVPSWDVIVNHRAFGKSVCDTFYAFSNGYGAGYPAWTLAGGANANYLFDDGSVQLFNDLKLGSNLDGPTHARVPVEAAMDAR